MSREQIEAAIPHRKPMLLLDEIVERGEDRIVCRKTFCDDEYFFQGHYPGMPLVPGVILCEAAMQAGAVLLSAQLSDAGEGAPVATRMNNVKFRQMVKPGDTIDIEITLNERMADAFFMTAKVSTGGKAAVRFDFACTVAKVE
jgi:3-hydroxyacyl-[acyl-carrier-protein] dehydratase